MTADIRSRVGRKREAHHNYKGGWRDAYGYIHIGDTLRSHIVWNEAHPEDPYQPGEVIHHINEIKDDDRPENLRKYKSQSEHWKEHIHEVVARRKRNKKGQFI